MNDRERVPLVAGEIEDLLRRRHSGELFFAELRGAAGWGKDSDRRIDAWTMHPYPSKQNKRIAYEIKVSRSDFNRDIRDPLKQRPAMLFSNEFYFVAPDGVIPAEKLPLGAGLIEVRVQEDHPDRPLYLHDTVPASWRDTEPPTWRFVAGLVRHAMKVAK